MALILADGGAGFGPGAPVALKDQTMTERINLVSDRICRAFLEGVDNYIPFLRRGAGLAGWEGDEEGGVTAVSTRNLERVGEELRLRADAEPIAVLARSVGALVVFGSDSHGRAGYLATGFAFGYRGEGPNGFARYLESIALDLGPGRALDIVADIPHGFEGVVWARPDVWPVLDPAEWREDVSVSLRALWPGLPSEDVSPANLARSGAPQDDPSERRAASRFGAAVRNRLRRGR